ncbi:thiazole synthase [Fluviispira multicolorata]|uniref:Thiazole synthase n=1 Tax=Fluviispira multicolorata TaxID=2654512 RepID=A0A833N0V5_9BACT|nr:thiazole synthase [Fluviispira multicolorata]KAB8029685.1 thiazole synthase [Fluviispira multicolorata]
MLNLYGEKLKSRFLIGSAKYPSLDILKNAVIASDAEVITVSIRRLSAELNEKNSFWEIVKSFNLRILPNTSGCYLAKDAITTAQMAREIFETNWIKLEVFGDSLTLQPNPYELLKAAEYLAKRDFCLFPYMTDDLVIAKELVNLGCEVLMPWASPIGSGKGIINPFQLQVLRERFPKITLIVDAGIGAPSHAARAMELGIDAVLLNSAVANAHESIEMAKAFSMAIVAGRKAFCSGIIPQSEFAISSSPMIGIPFQ